MWCVCVLFLCRLSPRPRRRLPALPTLRSHARRPLSLALSPSPPSLRTAIMFLPAFVAASAASPASRRTNSDAHAAAAATPSGVRRGGGVAGSVEERARMSLASLAMVAAGGREGG